MRVRHPHWLALGLAVTAALAGALAASSAGAAAGWDQGTGCRWLATWTAAAEAPVPARQAAADDYSRAGFADQTIRNVLWTSAGGQAARIRLSNQFGTRPVTFSQVDLSLSAGGPCSAAPTAGSPSPGTTRSPSPPGPPPPATRWTWPSRR